MLGKLTAAKKALGYCAFSTCRDRAVEGQTKCERHRKLTQHTVRKIYQERKAAGLCIRCGDPTIPDGYLCARCHEAERARLQARRTP
jgi:hypothetical protein